MKTSIGVGALHDCVRDILTGEGIIHGRNAGGVDALHVLAISEGEGSRGGEHSLTYMKALHKVDCDGIWPMPCVLSGQVVKWM